MKYAALLLVLVGVLILAMSPPSAAALGDQETADLKKAGLTDVTLNDLKILHEAQDRKRPVTMTVAEIQKLLKAEVPDEVIRLFIGLDWVTGDQAEIPITPDQAIQLKTAGISSKIVKTLLAAEISQASNRQTPTSLVADPQKAAPTSSPPSPDRPQANQQTPTGPMKLEKEVPVKEDFARQPGELRMGREVYHKPDGKQVIIYSSPFVEGPGARLGREVITRSDGKQIILYNSASPAGQNQALSQQESAEYQRALELLKYLRVNINPRRPR